MKCIHQHSFSVQFICSFTEISTKEMRESMAVKKTTLNLRLYVRNYKTSGNLGQVVEYSKSPPLVMGEILHENHQTLSGPSSRQKQSLPPTVLHTHISVIMSIMYLSVFSSHTMLVSPRAGAHLACYIIPGIMLGTKWHLTDGERRTDAAGGGGYRERARQTDFFLNFFVEFIGLTDRNEAREEEYEKGKEG